MKDNDGNDGVLARKSFSCTNFRALGLERAALAPTQHVLYCDDGKESAVQFSMVKELARSVTSYGYCQISSSLEFYEYKK